MIAQETLLVSLVKLVDHIPQPPAPRARKRGRPQTYSDRLFLKALVIMIVRHVQCVSGLLSLLEQMSAEMQVLRQLLSENGRYPNRRTFERRLKAMPTTLPAQIACLGAYLVAEVQPWSVCGRAAVLDSTVLRAQGAVWHKKDREQGIVPHTTIDTEAHWTKSGWHGWVYGWKLHVAAVVASVWIPLGAELTAANVSDEEIAPHLLGMLPDAVRFVLGDRHYNRIEIRQLCADKARILVTSQYGRYPHSDPGKDVRRIFHKLRSLAIENFNQHFKAIFDLHGQVPTRGLKNTQCFILAAILVYQLALLYRFQQHLDLNRGLKAFLKAA